MAKKGKTLLVHRFMVTVEDSMEQPQGYGAAAEALESGPGVLAVKYLGTKTAREEASE